MSLRLFGTLQGRLPQELRAAGITTIDAANRYLREVFLPAHNARFRVQAREAGTAFIPYVGRDLADILCVQEARVVGRDNCVVYKGPSLRIPPDRHRHRYVKASVRVHEYPDGHLAVFQRPPEYTLTQLPNCPAKWDHLRIRAGASPITGRDIRTSPSRSASART